MTGPHGAVTGKSTVLFSILAVHIAALTWLASERSERHVGTHPTVATGLTVIELPAPARLVTPEVAFVTPTNQAAILPPQAIVPPAASSMPPVQAAVALEVGNSDCDLARDAQAALRQSPVAAAALMMLPAANRSVANAMMLWDGAWIEGRTTTTRYALGKLREIIVRTVAAEPADCRRQDQIGPRFVTIPGTPDTVVALGSGKWRWAELQPVADPAPSVATATARQERASTIDVSSSTTKS